MVFLIYLKQLGEAELEFLHYNLQLGFKEEAKGPTEDWHIILSKITNRSENWQLTSVIYIRGSQPFSSVYPLNTSRTDLCD